MVLPPHTTLLAQRALKADTTYSCSPGEKSVATHHNFSYGQVLRWAEPRPVLQNGHALHSSLQALLLTVLSA